MFVRGYFVNVMLEGCRGFLCFRDSIMDSDLVRLTDTSHVEAHKWIFARSAFN